ncbi:MAG: alpha/beta fold hydrolase [Candidatus Muiribacteriota bacterium]
MTNNKSFEFDIKELEELKKKSEKFWEVINKCQLTTLDEKQNAYESIGIEPVKKATIFREGSVELKVCISEKKENKKIPPLLIVPSLINKYFILDLLSYFSLIEFLVNSGVRVYIIDWGIAGFEHGDLTIDDYITGYIRRCVRRMQKHSGQKKYNMLGQCIGGILSTVYAAFYSKDKNLKKHVSLTAPVDFENGGKLREWTDPKTFNLNKIVNSFREEGAVAAEFLHAGFQFLDLNLTFQKYRNLFNFSDNDGFVKLYRALDFWANDNIPFPVMVFKKFIHDFYQKNKLIKNELIIEDRIIKLSDIKIPFLNILASNDHVFPKEAGAGWKKRLSPHKKDIEKIYEGGHVSIVAALPVRLELYQDVLDFIK